MSDLPSREFAAGIPDHYTAEFNEWVKRVAIPLAVYWQSGRLVDRKSIDYEAAATTLHEVSIEMAEGDTYDAARLIVAAAIGDTG